MTVSSRSEEQDERGLLPYWVIEAASNGDKTAMRCVLQQYEKEIEYRSKHRFCDESGTGYYGLDIDICQRIQSKLIAAVLKFKI